MAGPHGSGEIWVRGACLCSTPLHTLISSGPQKASVMAGRGSRAEMNEPPVDSLPPFLANGTGRRSAAEGGEGSAWTCVCLRVSEIERQRQREREREGFLR